MQYKTSLYTYAMLATGGTALAMAGFFGGTIPVAYAEADAPDEYPIESSAQTQKQKTKIHQWFVAHGFRPSALQTKAAILGISVEDLEKRLQQGETMQAIVAAEHISLETWREKMREARIAHLKTLVANGSITKERMDTMVAHMKTYQSTHEKDDAQHRNRPHDRGRGAYAHRGATDQQMNGDI